MWANASSRNGCCCRFRALLWAAVSPRGFDGDNHVVCAALGMGDCRSCPEQCVLRGLFNNPPLHPAHSYGGPARFAALAWQGAFTLALCGWPSPRLACCTSGISSDGALTHSQLLRATLLETARPESSPPHGSKLFCIVAYLHARSLIVLLCLFLRPPLLASPPRIYSP